jgi:hypothetical protein
MSSHHDGIQKLIPGIRDSRQAPVAAILLVRVLKGLGILTGDRLSSVLSSVSHSGYLSREAWV